MTTSHPPLHSVKALFFDVFGTAVDWRTTVTRTLHTSATTTLSSPGTTIPTSVRTKASSMTVTSWGEFAQAWRQTYYTFTRSVAAMLDSDNNNNDDAASTSKPYKTVDQHHHDSLIQLLEENGLAGLWNDAEVKELSLVWHRLDPWTDTVEGIRRLNGMGFVTSTLSNGNVELLRDMAEFAGLEWKKVVSAEMFVSYKPNPKVYLGAAKLLGLRPEECGMVAAHLSDLKGARKCGFRTVYVERAREEAWDEERVAQTKREEWVDVWVTEEENGFITAAERLKG